MATYTLRIAPVLYFVAVTACGDVQKLLKAKKSTKSADIDTSSASGMASESLFAPKIKAEDFEVKYKLKKFTSRELVSNLSNTSVNLEDYKNPDLIGEKSPGNSTSEKDDKGSACFDQQMNGPIVAKGEEWVFEKKVNLSDCMMGADPSGNTNPPAGKVNLSFVTDLYFYMRCEGVDFTPYNGLDMKKVSEILQKNPCQKGQFFSSNVGTYEYSADVNAGGVTAPYKGKYLTYQASSTKDIKPCSIKWEGETTRMDEGCLDRVHKVIEDVVQNGKPQENLDELEIIQPQELVMKKSAKGEPYVISGARLVTFNDWSGKVSYSSSGAAPKYSLTNGIQTVDGEFLRGPSTALSLTEPSVDAGEIQQLMSAYTSLLRKMPLPSRAP